MALLAACLALGMVASIVLEAFDGDSDLWPFGTESFITAAHGESLTGSHLIGSVPALNAVLCTLMTAGAYLVLRHRARSALAADHSPVAMVSKMAEPWGCHCLVPGSSAIFVRTHISVGWSQ